MQANKDPGIEGPQEADNAHLLRREIVGQFLAEQLVPPRGQISRQATVLWSCR
jgi:hypothetical protein